MKKVLLFFLSAAILMTMLGGCAKQEEKTSEQTAQETQETQQDPEFYVLYNNVKLTVGVPFADVVDSLGEQTAPQQEIRPCDGGDAYLDVMHFYGNLVVTENKDGIIKTIELNNYDQPDSGALVNGVVSLGMKTEEVVEKLGKPLYYPIPEDDFALTYGNDEYSLVLFLDPDTNKETYTGLFFTLQEKYN